MARSRESVTCVRHRSSLHVSVRGAILAAEGRRTCDEASAKKFVSLSDVVKQLESKGFTRKRAQRAVCDMLYDRRFLKRLLWAERETPSGVIIRPQHVRRLGGVSSPGDIDWETSSLKRPLPDSSGRRLAKIEIQISDVTWYLNWGDLSARTKSTGAEETGAIKAPRLPPQKKQKHEICRRQGLVYFGGIRAER